MPYCKPHFISLFKVKGNEVLSVITVELTDVFYAITVVNNIISSMYNIQYSIIVTESFTFFINSCIKF